MNVPDPYLWLLPTVRLAKTITGLVLSEVNETLEFSPCDDALLAALGLLNGSHRLSTLQEQGLSTLINALDGERWLVRLERPIDDIDIAQPWLTRQLSYYACMIREFPDRTLAELSAARVAIVGAGGVGTQVALGLAGAGVGHLTLIDPDCVEPSNLNRQIAYSARNVGEFKVEALRKFLLERFETLRVNCLRCNPFLPNEVEAREKIINLDLVLFVGDGDTIWAWPDALGRAAVLHGGYNGTVATVGPLVSPAHGTPCWHCTLTIELAPGRSALDRAQIQRSRGWNSSGTAINALIASHLVEIAIRFLSPNLGGPIFLNEAMNVSMSTLESTRYRMTHDRCSHSSQTKVQK